MEPRWPGARRIVCEAFGTFALTFVAAGGDTMAVVSGGAIVPAARAVAPGLLVLALIYALGDTSGAHFNPVVSLGFALRGPLIGALVAVLVTGYLHGGAGGPEEAKAAQGTGT